MAWAPDYCTASQLKSWLRVGDTTDDTLLGFVITGASRDVDQFCGRQFGALAAATAWPYAWHGETIEGRQALAVHDFQTTTGLVVQPLDSTGAASGPALVAGTDFDPWPYTAVDRGQAWTHLVFRTGALSRMSRSMSVTAKWGWTAVPTSVLEATLITATEGFAWRNTPFGIAGSPEMGSELRVLQRVPVRAAGLLGPYKRHWGAA